VTATTESPSPSANSISVADGTSEAIRTGGTMALLSDEEIEQRVGALDGWERQGDAIVKEFENGDFKGSVDFVNRLMPVAEAMNHHPDLEISWATVKVSISTHSEGGLTANDFELAARIDALG